jgi:hypothetical protein
MAQPPCTDDIEPPEPQPGGMESYQRRSRKHAWQHEAMQGVTKVDWVLYALTVYPSTFLLQFATTPIARLIHYPRGRRVAMLVLLAIEIAVVVFALDRWVV